MSRLEELCFRAHRMDLDLEEDFYPYGDGGEVRAALRRKEEELVLAAQLGNALLTENRQLKEEKNKLQEQYTEKIEELEQDRHELRLKLQGCQAQWESQVGELERDVRLLNSQAERLTRQLSEAERDKNRSEEQHNRIHQQLQEQHQESMEVKLDITAELQSLKQELEERGHPRPQDEELLSALKEQVARLTQREQSLEQQMEAVCKENGGLRDSVSSLYTRLALQERQINTQTQQLAEAWQEVELGKGKVQDLQSQIEELQEEASFQRNTDANASLLSEMERSLDATNRSQDKEQELKRPIVGGNMAVCENPAWIQELQDQNAQLLKENAELRLKADSRLDKEIVQRAIKDRDDAISKKTAVEAELVRSRNDMMHLNNQLLEAIQRKLELSQELEAWQDDIQVIINQQLKSQTEQQMQSKRSGGGRISFFRKHLKARSSVSCIPETTAVSSGSPWINWLKVAK